jgi:hypothetical protein
MYSTVFTVWRKTFVKLAGFVNNDIQEKNSCAEIHIFVKTISKCDVLWPLRPFSP